MISSIKNLMSKLARGLAEREDRLSSGGHDEELQTMISRDMTLAEAVKFHIQDTWGYEHQEGFDHEAGHVLLGLAFNAPPHGWVDHLPYQGSYDSEIYNFEIEKVILGTMTGRTKGLYDDRQAFITGVLEHYRQTSAQENLHRTLGWIMSQETGKSYDALRKEAGYDDQVFKAQAEGMGIQFNQDEKTRAWSVRAPGYEDFHFIRAGEWLLPDADDFEPFERPGVGQIGEVYDRLLPALHILQNRILELDRGAINAAGQSFMDHAVHSMGETKVRDLYSAMINQRVAPSHEAALKHDEI